MASVYEKHGTWYANFKDATAPGCVATVPEHGWSRCRGVGDTLRARSSQCTMRVMRFLPVVLASLALQTACTPGATSSQQKRHDFPTYSISVPLTWTRTDFGPNSSHKGPYGFIWEGVRFEGPEGEYVDISPDLPTDLQGADTWLSATVSPGGEVVTQGANKLCSRPPSRPRPPEADLPYQPDCTSGDGRLDVWLFFEGRGHGYVITMGNDKREKAEDLPTVRNVVESMKLK